MTKEYLTEASLGEALTKIFANKEFIHNKTVPDSGLKTRPDFRSDELMLIVEYNGPTHYQRSSVQMRDVEKIAIYEEMGYKVVSVPYFIQLSTETIKHYFDVDFEWEQTYPHGFIDDKCVLPADFNTIGIRSFNNELVSLQKTFPDVANAVIDSLMDKVLSMRTKAWFFNAAQQVSWLPIEFNFLIEAMFGTFDGDEWMEKDKEFIEEMSFGMKKEPA